MLLGYSSLESRGVKRWSIRFITAAVVVLVSALLVDDLFIICMNE